MLNLRFPLAIQGAQLTECVSLKLVLKEGTNVGNLDLEVSL